MGWFLLRNSWFLSKVTFLSSFSSDSICLLQLLWSEFFPCIKRDVITDILGPWDFFLTLEDFVVVAESVEPREELECERGIWDRKNKRITIMKYFKP